MDGMWIWEGLWRRFLVEMGGCWWSGVEEGVVGGWVVMEGACGGWVEEGGSRDGVVWMAFRVF